jgi:ATPase
MAAQLEALIAELDVEIAEAEAAGDAEKIKELREARTAREAWLAQVTSDL